MNIQRILAIISLLLLSACGGGGSAIVTTTPQTQTVNGVVADGYLVGATVCLDTNLNKKCDSGEPSATTGSGGAYSIPNVPIADLAYPLVVEVPVNAVDSERGTVTTGYVLTAPAGKPEFVSPLTTLVQSQIETNGLTLDEAVATVKIRLGLTTISPMEDYKPGVAGAAAEAVVAAGVAKVIATAIAGNKQAIEAAVGASTSVTTQQVVNLSVQQIMQNLSTLVLQVKTATNSGANVLAEDNVAGVVFSSGVTVSTSDTTTLQQQLTAASTTNAANAMKMTVALQGSSATSVKAIQTTISLPAGVVLRSDATGTLFAGVLKVTGSAVTGILNGKYTPATATAPASLTLGFMTTDSLVAGDIIIINADLVSGDTTPAASAFTISASKLTDINGNSLDAASLTMR